MQPISNTLRKKFEGFTFPLDEGKSSGLVYAVKNATNGVVSLFATSGVGRTRHWSKNASEILKTAFGDDYDGYEVVDGVVTRSEGESKAFLCWLLVDLIKYKHFDGADKPFMFDYRKEIVFNELPVQLKSLLKRFRQRPENRFYNSNDVLKVYRTEFGKLYDNVLSLSEHRGGKIGADTPASRLKKYVSDVKECWSVVWEEVVKYVLTVS